MLISFSQMRYTGGCWSWRKKPPMRMKGRMIMAAMALARTKSPVSAEMKYAMATATHHCVPQAPLALLTSHRMPT